jgi:hypothetical protein
MANTRQSDSVTSTVFDYVIGTFNVCGFSATKGCETGSVTNGTDVNYNFKINVANTGVAPLYNVQVVEQLTGCSVSGSNDRTLAVGADSDFTITCLNVGLGATNTAQVKAKDDTGNWLTSKTVQATANSGACALNVTSDIALDGACDKVVLEDTGSRLGLEATIGLTVHAPASANSEALKNVAIDIYGKGCTGYVGDCTKLATISAGSLLKYGDANVLKSHTYDVAIGDDTSTSQCASSAIFQRRVIAHGVGAITNNTYWSNMLNGVPVAVAVDCKPCIDCADPQ